MDTHCCQSTPYLLQTGSGTRLSQIFLGLGTDRAQPSSGVFMPVVRWKPVLFADASVACYRGRMDSVRILLFLYWFVKKRQKYEKRGKFFISVFHINVC